MFYADHKSAITRLCPVDCVLAKSLAKVLCSSRSVIQTTMQKKEFIDKEKSEIDKARRVKSMKDFCGKMSVLLSLGKNYDDLIERMQLLDCRLSSYSINSTDFILNLVCYAKICELNSASESSISKYGPLKDIIINNAVEKETLKIHYLESLLVKKCENTCS